MKSPITVFLVCMILISAMIWKQHLKVDPTFEGAMAQTLEQKENTPMMLQASLPKKSTEAFRREAQAYEPNGESVEHFERQYGHSSEIEIRQEIEVLKLKLEDQIKTANSRRLSSEELTHLTEGIRKKVALQKILLNRKLQEVEAKL